jgi:hypothetical protein
VLPARGSGTGEDAWQPAFDALEQAILAAQPDSSHLIVEGVPAFPPTLLCIDDEGGCKTDLRDRHAALTPYLSLDEPDELAVIYGVNHTRTGKALYANFALIEETHQFGFAGINNDEMIGSASFYLPDEPLADDLYAYTIARDCTGRPEACIEVPATCPGVPYGEQLRVTFRAYLEASTGAAPLASELIINRAVKFWPTPQVQ